jgi:hypothetical protein
MYRVALPLLLTACTAPLSPISAGEPLGTSFEAPRSLDDHRFRLGGAALRAPLDGALDGANPGDYLGTSVAAGDMDGDGYADLLVGIPGWDSPFPEAGRVELYPGGPDGLSNTPTWFAEGEQPGAGLGSAVALAGDLDADGLPDLAAGAPGHDGSGLDAGRVYVWKGGALLLLGAFDGQAGGEAYGSAVASAGDVDADGDADLLIGAPGAAEGGPDAGRAELRLGGPSGPGAAAWSTAGLPGWRLGAAVAGAGDIDADGDAELLVGAPEADGGAGRALMFPGSPTGPGGLAWTVMGEAPGDHLGASVAGLGDTNGDGHADVLIGVPQHDVVGDGPWSPGDTGAEDSDWIGETGVETDAPEDTDLTAPGDTDGETDASRESGGETDAPRETGAAPETGGEIDLPQETDAAGETGNETPRETGAAAVRSGPRLRGGRTIRDAGQAQIFLGGPLGLPATPTRTINGDTPDMRLGAHVAAAGDLDASGFADAVVGAPGDHGGRGLVLVLHGGPVGLQVAWRAEGDGADHQLGASAGSAGDLDGDGIGDLFLGSPGAGGGAGRVVVVHGHTRPLSLVPSWRVESTQDDSMLGYMVSTAGDVDGDGYDDVVVGEPGWQSGASRTGRVVLFRGGPDGPSTVPDWEVLGKVTAPLGVWVAPAGDVNGDGFGDLFVGDPYYEPRGAYPDTDYGRSLVYHGSPAGLSRTPDWEVHQPVGGFLDGWNSRGAGDVNGDGYSDVIVVAPYVAVFLYLGGAGGLAQTPAWTSQSPVSWVDGAGDVNGDGYDDLLIGEDGWGVYPPEPDASAGRVVLFLGAPTGPSDTPSWEARGQDIPPQTAWHFGRVVAGAGDVNGDGYSDIAVGSPNAHGGNGRMDVFAGGPDGPGAVSTWSVQSPGYNGFGRVASAGDLNGDGYGDLAVRGPSGEAASTAQVYLGGPDGLSSVPAWRLDGQPSYPDFPTLTGAGDVNGDGFADLLFSHADLSGTSAASVYVAVFAGNGGPLGHWSAALQVQARSSELRAPLLPGLTSAETDRFGVALHPRGPWGRGRVRLQVELTGTREGWEEAQVYTGPAWTDAGARPPQLQLLLDGLAQGGGYRWRARALLDPAHGLPFAATAWKTGGHSGDGVRAHNWTRGWTWYPDEDGDGHGMAGFTVSTRTPDAPPGGSNLADDCDDGEPRVHPGAAESCVGRGIDEDCDGVVDGGLSPADPWYPDVDGDGHGAPPAVLSCTPPPGHVPLGDDCDDADPATFPGAVERCGEDRDCDGRMDDAVDAPTWYYDRDGDGHAGVEAARACAPPPGTLAESSDCDDADPAVSPSAAEVCSPAGRDEDCDRLTDDADPSVSAPAWYADGDGDGYGVAPPVFVCAAPSRHVVLSGDCDDLRADVHPGLPELCDPSADEDCDGVWEDADPDLADGLPWYADLDGDGVGGAALDPACAAPPDAVDRTGDCDDSDPDRFPDAAEVPGSGVDLDCSGDWICFVDDDGDGHGSGHDTRLTDQVCTAPGLAPTGDDCDDARADVHPDAAEIAGSGVDADCSGAPSCFLDADRDGFGGNSVITGLDPACEAPGEAPSAEDCDDTDPRVHPAATELPGDRVDEDCDGLWGCFVDEDGDGWGNGSTTDVDASDCEGTGVALQAGDCDDRDASAHPGAEEQVDNAVDEDCDGDAFRTDGDPKAPEACACESGGPGFGWAGLLLVWLRRRR